MKQYITFEQYNELNDEEKVILIDSKISLCFPLLLNSYVGYPNFGIGQMIEFLGNNWEMNPFVDVSDHGCPVRVCDNERLCDNLWEAVKDKIRKKS